jgi:hypothetical protein
MVRAVTVFASVSESRPDVSKNTNWFSRWLSSLPFFLRRPSNGSISSTLCGNHKKQASGRTKYLPLKKNNNQVLLVRIVGTTTTRPPPPLSCFRNGMIPTAEEMLHNNN